MMMKKKKRIIITLTITVIALISICGILQYRYDTKNVTFASSYGDTLAVIPICSHEGACIAYFKTAENYNMNITIDTGTDNTYIDLLPNDFEIMTKNGLISSQWGIDPPSLSSTALSRFGFKSFKVYHIGNLPIIDSNTHIEYKNNTYNIQQFGHDIYMNELQGIPIIKTSRNLMGIPVLLDKIVEFSKKNGEMRFHKFIPSDYKRFIELKEDKQKHSIKFDKDHFIINPRQAMPVEVNGHQYMFFIDTGHGGNVAIRLPNSEAKLSHNHLVECSMKGVSGKDSATVHFLRDDKGIVTIGRKKYQHAVHYTDDQPTKYVINPFAFFDEDFILDFKNKKILFKE